MSRNDWESGTITLPAVEVAGIKKALRDWTNTFHAEVRAEAVRIHKDVLKGTRSLSLYKERLAAVENAYWMNRDTLRLRQGKRAAMVHAAALRVLDGIRWGAQNGTASLHQPTVADVDRVIARATNRTTTFTAVSADGYTAATITFDGRSATWEVMENNHAVETAHESPLGAQFLSLLSRIEWTRGTGGYFVGNDEYNEDAREHGFGANYLTSTFGPLGTEAKIQDHMNRGFSKAEATRFVTGRA